MKNTQKGGMLIWLIVIIIILGGAVYIKALKKQIADLKEACVVTTTSSLTTQ